MEGTWSYLRTVAEGERHFPFAVVQTWATEATEAGTFLPLGPTSPLHSGGGHGP
jgi:hypothetical protein